MEEHKKCSWKKHQDIDAISYCIECNVFMCNKCLNAHSEFLEDHHKCNLDKNFKDVFTGICKEKNHNIQLEFYCSNHNELCCAACLSKIKNKGYGQHHECNVSSIEDIKEQKINKLKENIKYLEDISKTIENSVNELKQQFEKINEKKEELKNKISTVFTQIRSALNEREDQLLLEVDKKFEDLFFKENLIKEGKKLPLTIKNCIEKGKIINQDCEQNKITLNSKINECINIENIIKNINEINNNIEKESLDNIKISFAPEKDELNTFLGKIKEFGTLIIEENNKDINEENKLLFKFKPGENYIVNENGHIATKTSGGNDWNCTIIGDKEIPKNKTSKWMIRINNFEIKSNTWNVLIGIGPNNNNNENRFYNKCWSFICGQSQLSIKSGSEKKYNNHSGKLKKGDIIETTVDRQAGTLSFAVNGIDYGIAFSEVPKEDILYPIVMIYDQNQIVEII